MKKKGIQCRYLSSSKDLSSQVHLHLREKLGWKLLEKRTDHDLNHNLIDGDKTLNSFIPGGGVAQKLLNTWLFFVQNSDLF